MAFSAGLFDVLTLNHYGVYGTGGIGTYANPEHLLIDGFEDLDGPNEKNPIGPMKIRRFKRERYLAGQSKGELSMSLATEPGNAVWELLRAAHINDTPVEVFMFFHFIDDGTGLPDSGSRAVRDMYLITQWNDPQKLEGFDVNELKLMPSANPVDPNDPDTETVPEYIPDYTVP